MERQVTEKNISIRPLFHSMCYARRYRKRKKPSYEPYSLVLPAIYTLQRPGCIEQEIMQNVVHNYNLFQKKSWKPLLRIFYVFCSYQEVGLDPLNSSTWF